MQGFLQEQQLLLLLQALLQFLLTEFSRIFGSGTMFAEECVVFNDQGADCPMLIINLSF